MRSGEKLRILDQSSGYRRGSSGGTQCCACGTGSDGGRTREARLCGKTIANTIADGRRIIEACQKAGVTLMVGHYRRRNAGNRKLKELIHQGVIGKPIMIEANDSSGLGFELTPDKFRWRGDDTGCPAGSLMTIGIHTVDVFNLSFRPDQDRLFLFQ